MSRGKEVPLYFHHPCLPHPYPPLHILPLPCPSPIPYLPPHPSLVCFHFPVLWLFFVFSSHPVFHLYFYLLVLLSFSSFSSSFLFFFYLGLPALFCLHSSSSPQLYHVYIISVCLFRFALIKFQYDHLSLHYGGQELCVLHPITPPDPCV